MKRKYERREDTAKRLLPIAMRMFLTKGYDHATTTVLAKEAGISQASFFTAYKSKEELLLEIVKRIFPLQMQTAQELMPDADPILVYMVETTLQLQPAELSESLRNTYVAALSLPTITEYLCQTAAVMSEEIFSDFFPGDTHLDYFGREIAALSISRGFCARPCGQYFTMERKIRSYLMCCFGVYGVPKEIIANNTDVILNLDLESAAGQMLERAIELSEQNA